MNPEFRTEHDSMGEVQVPRDALYAAQTQRAVDNFQISDLCLPAAFITTLAQIKAACARANAELGLLEKEQADAIVDAADQLIAGEHLDQFPVDVFQTGSGTSSNMNMNEVLSALIKQRTGLELHPNDHINMSQSSNDVIPTCIHVSALLQLENSLIPALRHLVGILTRKRSELSQIVKTGRTHLMDAMPIRMDQEVSGWLTQIQDCIARLESVRPRLLQVAQGGTAVGTGVNAPRAFSRLFCRQLSIRTGLTLQPAQNHFTAQACQDTAVELSGQLKTCATALMKIANDLRWMNSGPLAGLGEIALPALQPGSSIMPGKVNPVIPEAVNQTAYQVIAADLAVTLAAEAGQLQLNAMEPLIVYNLLNSIKMLTSACTMLENRCIRGIRANEEQCARHLGNSIGIVTALVPYIGYSNATRIASTALTSGSTVRELVLAEGLLPEAKLDAILSPHAMLAPVAVAP